MSLVNNALNNSSWQDLPHGQILLDAINLELESWYPNLFGFNLLKLGRLSQDLVSHECSILNHYTLNKNSIASIIGDETDLPIKNSCIDLILMALKLETSNNPYLQLREVDRVITVGGHIVIIGFNPLSQVILGKLLPKFKDKFPWNGHLFPPFRVKDWLGLLGYQIIDEKKLFYNSFLRQSASDSKFMQRFFPGSASIYILLAKKLDSPLTPIKIKKKLMTSSNWLPQPCQSKTNYDAKLDN